MNTANLQIEGLTMAVAALLQHLKQKQLLTSSEIDGVLRGAETLARNDAEAREQLRSANVDAVTFPIRLLIEANQSETLPGFTALARRVGREKDGLPADGDETYRLASAVERERDA